MGMESGPEKPTKSLDNGFKDPKILVQIVLAQMLSPNETNHRKVMSEWYKEENGIPSLATRFGDHLAESEKQGQFVSLDVDDENAMQELLDAIQTRH